MTSTLPCCSSYSSPGVLTLPPLNAIEIRQIHLSIGGLACWCACKWADIFGTVAAVVVEECAHRWFSFECMCSLGLRRVGKNDVRKNEVEKHERSDLLVGESTDG